jgi:hypothetical protein
MGRNPKTRNGNYKDDALYLSRLIGCISADDLIPVDKRQQLVKFLSSAQTTLSEVTTETLLRTMETLPRTMEKAERNPASTPRKKTG